MDNFKLFLNKNKIPFKESIKNSLRIKEKENINITIEKYAQHQNKNVSENRYINNNIKFSELNNKLFLKRFNKYLQRKDLHPIYLQQRQDQRQGFVRVIHVPRSPHRHHVDRRSPCRPADHPI